MFFIKTMPMILSVVVLTALSCSLISPDPATNIQLPAMFTDNMVLQHEIRVPVWGTADPGGKIIVEFGNHKKKAIVSKEGQWRVNFSPLYAGGPYELTIKGKEFINYKNVMVGEVWICSGQSNMQWPVSSAQNAEQEIAEADYPNIRLFSVHRTMSVIPKSHLDCDSWQVCSPATMPNFSAVGYFFGRHLHKKLNIPIGLIHTSWGGTVAEAWTSGTSLKEIPAFAEIVQEMETEAKDEEQLLKDYEQKMEEWRTTFDQKVKSLQKGKTWEDPNLDMTHWKRIKLPTLWEKAGLENFDGAVWFRKEVKIPKSWEGQELTLQLGPINDIDITYFNGTRIGSEEKHDKPRIYKIPGNLIKPGRNVIAVEVIDIGNNGGIWGVPEQLKLVSNSDNSIPLAVNWHYQVGPELKDIPPRPQSPDNPNRPTVLYNAMISPLIPFAIRGAIWYQGESNAGRAYQYRTLFPTLINDWRAHWGQGDLPFLFVQLANFRAVNPEPVDDAWAELREAQLMALSLPNTGMAVTIDIGEADDIHPRNKQDVGKRLALNALHLVYGKDVDHSGPIYKSMAIEGGKIRLTFDHVGDGLIAKDGEKLTGFAIAGVDKKFYWADAIIDGETLVASSSNVPEPVAVRYAWSTNPVCNFYNKAGLPASPFRTDSWPGITQGVE